MASVMPSPLWRDLAPMTYTRREVDDARSRVDGCSSGGGQFGMLEQWERQHGNGGATCAVAAAGRDHRGGDRRARRRRVECAPDRSEIAAGDAHHPRAILSGG